MAKLSEFTFPYTVIAHAFNGDRSRKFTLTAILKMSRTDIDSLWHSPG